MSDAFANLGRRENKPNFMLDLLLGRFRWDLIRDFPRQDPADQARGDEVVATFRAFLDAHVDPLEIDSTGALPKGLVDNLRAHGFLAPNLAPEHGGLGLSTMNTFRVIETAAGWCMPVALVMAVEAGIGIGAYLPHLPDGPLKDGISERMRQGVVSGTADTGPEGAANRLRSLTAVPTDDGTGYVLNGAKVNIGNGSLADFLCTTATVRDEHGEEVRLFIVDTRSPGFQVEGDHEFMGLRGFPNAALRFDQVYVPAENLVHEESYDGRLTPAVALVLSLGRVYLISGPSLAISKRAVQLAREYASRRVVDERSLKEYSEIRHLISASLAEVFAIESMVDWALLAPEKGMSALYDQHATKNIVSQACWRVVESSMSILAAEGFETAESKARRGVPALPMERLFRDARGLRISGGVDFQLDNWYARGIVFAHHYPPMTQSDLPTDAPSGLTAEHLSERNVGHLRHVDEQVRRFGRACAGLARRYPDRAALQAQERVQILIGRIGTELYAMGLTLARAEARSGTASAADDLSNDLADIFCTAARHRLADCWAQFDEAVEQGERGPREEAVAASWLDGAGPALPVRDLDERSALWDRKEEC
jgi:alkylation response protein AidB-like acyl-CoA dehydrogenase